jgi:Tfp pilus assembly protein PilV
VHRGSSTDARGFSLVDALIASLILATALASLAQLVVSATAANDAAGRITIATLLAIEKIEELQSAAAAAPGGAGADSPRPGFTREWSVNAAPPAPAILAIIQVAVRTNNSETRMFAVMRRSAP